MTSSPLLPKKSSHLSSPSSIPFFSTTKCTPSPILIIILKQIRSNDMMQNIIELHRHLHLFLLLGIVHLSRASYTPSFYYDQCAPSKCGNSILQFPFGRNSLCRSAYIGTLCENETVFITDEENPNFKYKLLQNLTEQVYSNKVIKLVDVSLFGCGPISPLFGSSPIAGYESQKWIMLGSFHLSSDYRMVTFFNCTNEPDHDTLSKLIKAPCLECGDESSNLCYLYDGYRDGIPNCIAFRVAIPVRVLSNFSGFGNLRKVLEEGFDIGVDGVCNPCMEMDGGRCGYLNQERISGEEFCFCHDGIHKDNCSDGMIMNYGAKETRQNPSHTTRIVMIAGIVVGTALVLCASYIYYKRSRPRHTEFRGDDEEVLRRHLAGDYATPASVETFLHNYTLGRPTRFSYKQLKKYTNNFTHKLGQGGCSSVFKGQLPNGFTFAVKIIDETDHSETQFLNEVLTIGQIHHSHLVRLLGFCFEQPKKALIYEFMVNGSLDKYIHPKNQGSIEKLTWKQLQDIAIGTAKGIAYLHDECRSRILHCDIKPHNILLDDKFKSKVSDFGLALTLNRENSHVSVTHGMGTPGYAPPEMWLMHCGPVTDKSDVYSFGMLVLEMAGQRRNFEVDASKSSQVYFPEWVFSHHVMNVNGDSGDWKWHACEGEEEEEIARRMELVGLWCIQFEASKRPSMRKVVDMLEDNVAVEIPPRPLFGDIIPACDRV